MILEIILGFVIACLVGLLFYEKEAHAKERRDLVNAIIAKTPDQLSNLRMSEKVKPVKPSINVAPDLVAERDLSDDEFKKYIKREVG
jgi:hypothetical protein